MAFYELQQFVPALANKELTPEQRCTEFLYALGSNESFKGFRFLRKALLTLVQEPDLIDELTTKVFPRVAEAYGTNCKNVDRNIRTCIKKMYEEKKPTFTCLFKGITEPPKVATLIATLFTALKF